MRDPVISWDQGNERMKRFRIVHTTEYRFSNPISACRLELRLQPREIPGQCATYFQIVTRPPLDERNNSFDSFGNHLIHLQIQSDLQRMLISAISTVTKEMLPEIESTASKPWQAEVRKIAAHEDTRRFCEPTTLTPASPEIAAYARAAFNPGKPLLSAAADLSHQIHSDMVFMPGTSHVGTSADEVLSKGQGVCQDFAHLAIACLRSMGLTARYISGYVHTAASRGPAHRIASDASHAWFEIFDPDSGWVGFDPTNDQRVDDNYITVAWGRDYSDACPLQGTFEGGGAHSLHVSVDVEQIL